MIGEEYPEARYLHRPERLGPQAARNEGVRLAGGEILVFTDADVYPPPHWLADLVAALERHAVVLGAIACHGDRWLDRGIHLCKFSICLPGGRARAVELGWSGNIAMPRHVFAAGGGWEARFVQGDSVFTDRLRRAGNALWFEPGLVVVHDHAGVTLRRFLSERFLRGSEFASIEAEGALGEERRQRSPRRRRLIGLPLEVARSTLLILGAARKAGMLREALLTLPIVLSGVAAWHSGMCRPALRPRR